MAQTFSCSLDKFDEKNADLVTCCFCVLSQGTGRQAQVISLFPACSGPGQGRRCVGCEWLGQGDVGDYPPPFLCLRFLGYEGDMEEITASLFKNHLILFQLSLNVLRTKLRVRLSPPQKPVK